MPHNRTAKINRLKRIEGQIRGIAQMVADDRYCIDILHQVQAVRSALASVESAVLKDHAACCGRYRVGRCRRATSEIQRTH